MAYEVFVQDDIVNNERTKSRSVTYLIRKQENAPDEPFGFNVRKAQVPMLKGENALAYGNANAETLYGNGTLPVYKSLPLAAFYAAKSKSNEAYFLSVIFAGLHQLMNGGSLADMVNACRTAFGLDDEQLAAFLAFESAWNEATDADRNTITLMALYVALNTTVASE